MSKGQIDANKEIELGTKEEEAHEHDHGHDHDNENAHHHVEEEECALESDTRTVNLD